MAKSPGNHAGESVFGAAKPAAAIETDLLACTGADYERWPQSGSIFQSTGLDTSVLRELGHNFVVRGAEREPRCDKCGIVLSEFVKTFSQREERELALSLPSLPPEEYDNGSRAVLNLCRGFRDRLRKLGVLEPGEINQRLRGILSKHYEPEVVMGLEMALLTEGTHSQAHEVAPSEDVDGAPHKGSHDGTGGGRPKQHRQKNHVLETTRPLLRQMRKEKYSQQDMCRRLGNSPRPVHAEWRDLPWPDAYKNKKYTNSVKKWLSNACKV